MLTVVVAGLMIVYSLYNRIAGNLYLEQLNYIDATTITMIGILLLRGVVHLRYDLDGQATSIALIGALSFVFCFEALYKLSFFAFPWRMPPAELREFIIQVGIALTALEGSRIQQIQFLTGQPGIRNCFRALLGRLACGGLSQLTNGKLSIPRL